MAKRNSRRGFLSRIWDAITARPVQSAPKQRPTREVQQPAEYRFNEPRIREYIPTTSTDNEQLANKLIRQFESFHNPKYGGRVDHNRVRQNVEKMSPEVKRYALALSDDTLQYEAMMGNITDDDGNNLFWYH